MSEQKQSILLGEISGVFGVRGWVKIFSYTSPRIKITEYKTWYLEKTVSGKPDLDEPKTSVLVTVLQGRIQGKNIIARLEGVNDRDQAEALLGSRISISREQLEDLPEGEFYWRDLQGLNVKTVTGEALGRIDWLFDTGSNDVMVIDGKALGEPERMIPFIMNDVVKSIDLNESLMIVDWDYEF